MEVNRPELKDGDYLALNSGWNDYGYHLLYNYLIDGVQLGGHYRLLFLNEDNHCVSSGQGDCFKTSDVSECCFYGNGDFDFYKALANLDDMTEKTFDIKLNSLHDVLTDKRYSKLRNTDVPVDSHGYSPVDRGLFRDYDPIYFIEFIKESKVNIFKLLKSGHAGATYFIEHLGKENFSSIFNSWLTKDTKALKYLNDFISVIKSDQELLTDSSSFLKSKNLLKTLMENKKSLNNLLEITNNNVSVRNDTHLLQSLSSLFGKDEREIVDCVQKIEKALKCKDEELEGLGQYTPISTLKFVLPKINDKSNQVHLRLTNGNQLNDPMEGSLLFEILKIGGNREDYNSTNNFLASLTSASDNLPMWKQYGDDASGVYAIISSEYLKGIQDSLYHTCYIDTDGSDKIFDFKFYVNGDDDNANVNKIKDSLISIKETIDSMKKEKENDKKLMRVTKYMDRISFLFKNSDYSYENEYRILKNEIDRNNIILTVNGDRFMLYTYIFNDTKDSHENLSYSEIMLGPNSRENINYIAEYIKLTSPKTRVTSSKIQYR